MITLNQAYKDFVIAKKAENRSPETIRTYGTYLKRLLLAKGDSLLTELQPADIRAMLANMQERHKSDESLRALYRNMKSFFNWAWREYGLNPSQTPMRNIRVPQAKHHEPKGVDPEDVVKLLDACDQTVRGTRDRALILFLYDTGCRAAGAYKLRRSDLNLDRGEALVCEKDQRTRYVHFTEPTAEALRKWLKKSPVKTDLVFYSLRMQSRGNRLTASGVWRALRYVSKKAGIKGRANPHAFRHGFAREFIQRGGDLSPLRQLMGHSSIAVTAAHYAVFHKHELHNNHHQFSPVKGLGLEPSTNGFLDCLLKPDQKPDKEGGI
ncbi:Tyrosine recombinase XerC [Anaerolineae bacterium]|nr:Tyrosine recombinase XerC [Anaerolineae bacterium]